VQWKSQHERDVNICATAIECCRLTSSVRYHQHTSKRIDAKRTKHWRCSASLTDRTNSRPPGPARPGPARTYVVPYRAFDRAVPPRGKLIDHAVAVPLLVRRIGDHLCYWSVKLGISARLGRCGTRCQECSECISVTEMCWLQNVNSALHYLPTPSMDLGFQCRVYT